MELDDCFRQIIKLTFIILPFLILINPLIPINFQKYRRFSRLLQQPAPPFVFCLFHKVMDISQANTSFALLQAPSSCTQDLINQISSTSQYKCNYSWAPTLTSTLSYKSMSTSQGILSGPLIAEKKNFPSGSNLSFTS